MQAYDWQLLHSIPWKFLPDMIEFIHLHFLVASQTRQKKEKKRKYLKWQFTCALSRATLLCLIWEDITPSSRHAHITKTIQIQCVKNLHSRIFQGKFLLLSEEGLIPSPFCQDTSDILTSNIYLNHLIPGSLTGRILETEPQRLRQAN